MSVIDSVTNFFTTDYERALNNSVSTTAGSVSYEQMLQSMVPPTMPTTTENLEQGKWDTFTSRAARQVNTDIGGLMNFAYEYFAKEPNYNVFKDPEFTSQSPEFQVKYARNLMDSPNAQYTRGSIQKAKETEELMAKTSENFYTGIAGDMVGSLFNVSNLLGFRATLANVPRIVNAARVSGVATGAVAIQELGRQQEDITVSDQEVAMNVGSTMALGAFLGYLGSPSMSPKFTQNAKTILNPNAPLKAETLEDVLAAGGNAGAARVATEEGYNLAMTNSVFKKLAEVSDITGAELRGLQSPSKQMNYYTNLFTSHNYLIERNLKGEASPISLVNMIDSEFKLKFNPLRTNLDTAYAGFKKEGGKLNQDEFLNEAFEVMAGVKQTSSREVSDAARNMRNYFDTFAQRISSVDPTFKPRQNYIPGIFDRRSVIKNQAELRKDITNELLEVLRRENATVSTSKIGKGVKADKSINKELIPADIEDPVFAEAVNAIYQKIALDSAGNTFSPAPKSWTAKNLKSRYLNFSNEFYNKYRSKDVMHIFNNYGRQASRDINFQKYLGVKDPYKIIDNVKDDYSKLLQDVEKRTDISNRNELIESLQKNLERDILDADRLISLSTGKFNQGASEFTRDTTAVLKALVYMRTMGKVIFSMVPDLVRVATSKLTSVGLGDDILQTSTKVADVFKAIPDRDVGRLFGVVSDRITGVARSSLFSEVIDLNVPTKIEQGTKFASSIFSRLNLMDPLNNITRTAIAEDVSRKVLKYSRDLIDGKLVKGSSEYLELSKLGIDSKLAKKIINSFDTHQEVTEFGGKKVLTTGIDSWDPNVSAPFIAAVQRAVDNTIIVPTPGAKPFWTQTPWGSVISQLKGFSFISLNKYLLPAMQNMAGVNPKESMKAMSVILADLLVASQVAMLQDWSGGREVNYTPEALLASALTKNSTFAILGFGFDAAGMAGLHPDQVLADKPSYYHNGSDYVKGMAGMLLGPSARYSLDIVNNIYDSNTNGYSDSEYRKSLQLLPGQNLIYWGWLINQIGRQPNNNQGKPQ